MGAKRALAFDITRMYHGEAAAQDAEEHFDRVVRRGERPEEIPEVRVAADAPSMWLPRVMAEAGLTTSTSEAVRLIKQRAIQVDGKRITDKDHHVETADPCLIQRGKRRFVRVRFG